MSSFSIVFVNKCLLIKNFIASQKTKIFSEFPLHELADEYYWINHLIRIGAEWESSNVVFCNPDPTKTQALVLNLTPNLLRSCVSDGYAFIRKMADIDAGVVRALKRIYSA